MTLLSELVITMTGLKGYTNYKGNKHTHACANTPSTHVWKWNIDRKNAKWRDSVFLPFPSQSYVGTAPLRAEGFELESTGQSRDEI